MYQCRHHSKEAAISRRARILFGTAALVAATIVLVPSIALAGDPCFHQLDNRPAPSTGSTNTITLGDCVFTPTVNQVAVGTLVTWRNTSIQAHEVVGSNLAWGAHDKLLEPGETMGWSFDRPGIYAYSCMLHPGMTGTIVVGGVAAVVGAPAPVANPTPGSPSGDSAAGAAAGAAGGISPGVVVMAAGGGVGLGFLAAGLLRRRRPSLG